MRKLCLIILLFVVPAAGSSKDTTRHITVAGRDVAIWKPAGSPPQAGYPLILFSHGFSGCNTQSIFLAEALAQSGYLVLAPNHKDSHCGSTAETERGWYPGKFLKNAKRPEEPFRDEKDWTDATYKDRLADIEAVLDAALREKTFQGVAVDRQRIGIAGHSLGGYTALGVAGAWPSWKDNRIKAVLALSPFCSPFVLKGDLAEMNVPVMYQGGTRDLGVTPTVKRLNGAYDHSSAPKYYVEFDGAGHLAWTNLKTDYQEIIDRYSVAFFNHYLRAKDGTLDELDSLTVNAKPKGVSYLRVDVKQ